MKFSKNVNNKKCAPKIIFFNENFFRKIRIFFTKLTLKARILTFLTTFAQLSARLKNFLGGWLLVLGLEEGLVECATVCVKSVVILILVSKNFRGNQENFSWFHEPYTKEVLQNGRCTPHWWMVLMTIRY